MNCDSTGYESVLFLFPFSGMIDKKLLRNGWFCCSLLTWPAMSIVRILNVYNLLKDLDARHASEHLIVMYYITFSWYLKKSGKATKGMPAMNRRGNYKNNNAIKLSCTYHLRNPKT